MLASEVPNIQELRMPVLATPKIDGIRCLTRPTAWKNRTCDPATRSLKEVPNEWVFQTLTHLPPGLDGELVSGDSFQQCQSAFMSQVGWGFEWKYYIFDYIPDEQSWDLGYETRVNNLRKLKLPEFCEILIPTEYTDLQKLLEFAAYTADRGYPYEGAICRPSWSRYKLGRSTPKQQWMVKIKMFDDSEAEVIGFKELMRNENTPEKDERGYQKRAHRKDGMVPAGTLGAILCRDVKSGKEFSCGSGFDAGLRQVVWDNRSKFLGQTIKYKWQIQGTMDKPRIPIFMGFRDPRDM